MTRTIQFQDVSGEPNLRQITVTINYTVASKTRSFVLVCYISAFA
jgi:hypothetical protein